jgi:hypothetical protein
VRRALRQRSRPRVDPVNTELEELGLAIHEGVRNKFTYPLRLTFVEPTLRQRMKCGLRWQRGNPDAAEAQERHLREQAAARAHRDKKIFAADAAGNPNVKVEAQMIRRDEEDNRRRWAGTRQSLAAYDP